jgi:RND family efflux transporter MFP subunit
VEVAARYSNPMSFRVPGKVIERKVRIGDTVKKGEVVARLDPIDAERQAASAKAALDAADHRLLFAKQQLERDTAQAAQNLIATNQLEQTQDAFTAAQSGREEAAAQWVVAHNNLEYNTLIVDHDGVITSENADTGQVVSAGQAIYGLAWSGDTDVTLDASASDLGRIAVGQSATVTFPALPGKHFDARVREITPAADPQSRTYRVKLTLTHPGEVVRLGMTGDAVLGPMPAGSGGGVAAGAVGESAAAGQVAAGHRAGGSTAAGQVAVGSAAAGSAVSGSPAGRSAAAGPGAGGSSAGELAAAGPAAAGSPAPVAATFTLPATAIFHKGNSPAVWVITNNSTLELRAISVGSYTDHSTVVTNGLKDGDTVVLAGVHTVYAGERVTAARPLFDDAGDVEGTAPDGSSSASTVADGAPSAGAEAGEGAGSTAGVSAAARATSAGAAR